MRRKHDDCSHCGCKYAIATPDEICAYLDRMGWVRMEDLMQPGSNSRVVAWAVYRLGSDVEIEVPLMRKAADWLLCYNRCLDNIWRVERKKMGVDRSIAELVDDMLPAQERIERAENEMLRWGEVANKLGAA